MLELTHLVLWVFPPLGESGEVWGCSFHPASLRVGSKGPIHSSLPLSTQASDPAHWQPSLHNGSGP